MIIDILTLFPEVLEAYVSSSILGRAQQSGRAEIRLRNFREFATDRHRVADDAPYGGGPGMLLKAEPIARCIAAVEAERAPLRPLRVFLSPDGEPWSQQLAREFAELPALMLLCGHYEGVDERVRAKFIDREISLGDFVLTGGEIPALAVVDSVVRLLPGVLGNEESLDSESFERGGLLDCPHYTRPEEYEGHRVPPILLTGHHARIEQWRRRESLRRTRARRPDLFARIEPGLSPADRALLESPDSDWES